MSERGGFTDDHFLAGRLLLRQPRAGHRVGHDAMLLAASTAVEAGDRIVEFGAGVGAAGLALTRRVAGCDLMMLEIDPELVALARHNASVNNVTAAAIAFDVTASAEAYRAAGIAPDSVDVVMMNPPFNDCARHRASPFDARRRAHVADHGLLVAWIDAARRILRSSGCLTLIWRADGLSEVLQALQRGFGSVTLQPVHAQAEKPAIRLLVRAIKGGRAPLTLYPPCMLNDRDSQPSADATAIVSGEGILPLARLPHGR